MLRPPGLLHKFDELKSEYNVDTYADLVEEVEMSLEWPEAVARRLKRRYGKVDVDTIRTIARKYGYKVKLSDAKFVHKLRTLYRLPAPGNITIGPYKDNPLLVLLGTYGKLKRIEVKERIEKVHYKSPYELLALAYENVEIKRGRAFLREWRIIQELALGPSGDEIILKKPTDFTDIVGKTHVPVVRLEKIIRDDDVLIPV